MSGDKKQIKPKIRTRAKILAGINLALILFIVLSLMDAAGFKIFADMFFTPLGFFLWVAILIQEVLWSTVDM